MLCVPACVSSWSVIIWQLGLGRYGAAPHNQISPRNRISYFSPARRRSHPFRDRLTIPGLTCASITPIEFVERQANGGVAIMVGIDVSGATQQRSLALQNMAYMHFYIRYVSTKHMDMS